MRLLRPRVLGALVVVTGGVIGVALAQSSDHPTAVEPTTTAFVEPSGTRPPRSNTAEQDRDIPPLPPVVAEARRLPAGAVNVKWSYDSGSARIVSCVVYRKQGESAWSRVGEIPVDPTGAAPVSFVDASARLNTTYVYAVTAVDIYGHSSILSDPVIVPA